MHGAQLEDQRLKVLTELQALSRKNADTIAAAESPPDRSPHSDSKCPGGHSTSATAPNLCAQTGLCADWTDVASCGYLFGVLRTGKPTAMNVCSMCFDYLTRPMISQLLFQTSLKRHLARRRAQNT